MDAAATADGKAQAVLDALANPVTVRVYDGSGNVMGTGTMQSPWATRSGNVLTIGELASFLVGTSGTPTASTWYLRFESGSRWVRGPFGLSGDTAATFTWSLPTWEATQIGELGTVTMTFPATTAQADATATYTVAGASTAFAWLIPEGTPYAVGNLLQGATLPIASLYTAGSGANLAFSVVSGPAYLTVDADTGAITATPDATPGAFSISIDGGLDQGIFEPAILDELQPEQYRTIDDETDEYLGGISASHYYRRLALRWRNSMGDYIGHDGTLPTIGADVSQGGNPFCSGSVASGVGYKTFDVAAIVSRALTTGRNKGWFLRMTGTNSPSVTWAGRLSANPPLLSVTTSAGVFSCPCILSTRMGTDTVLPVNGTVSFTNSATRNGVLQFDLSGVTGAVTSATLSLYANALFGSTRTLQVFELDPPTFQLGAASIPPTLGLAAEVGENNLADANGNPLHPDVYCAGHFEGTTFPTSSSAVAPRIKWGTISRRRTVDIVPDPDAPGTSYWRGEIFNEISGVEGNRGVFKRFYDFTPALTSDTRYPIDVSKKVEECYVRAYFMWETDFLDMTEGCKAGIGIQLQYGYWMPVGGPPNYGYWQPYGGNSNSYGDGMKHFGDCHDTAEPYLPNPAPSGTGYYFHNETHTDIAGKYFYKGCMQFNLCGRTGRLGDPHRFVRPFQGYNYNIDATDVYGEGQSTLANVVPVRFQLGRWYCWEQYIKMNTLDFTRPIYGPKDGSFHDNYEANPDGIHRTWINGVLVDEKTNFRWRRNMDMGVDAAGIEWYYGGSGTTSLAAPMHFRINHVVVAKRYIGPRIRP